MEKMIRWLGNFLIFGALAILFYIYLPLFNIYFNPTKLTPLPDQGYFLTIPKINAQAPIFEGVNPWKESDYQPILQQGIASAQGFANPTTRGPIFLFAHSSDNPWNITRSNTIFLKLPELEIGDQIYLTKDGQKYDYTVQNKTELWPNQTEFLNTKEDLLFIQTCVPIGTSLKRLIITATPTKNPA